MSKPYAVYSIFVVPGAKNFGNRELITRHRWCWMARLWAAECKKLFPGFRFEVVDERNGGAA